MTPSLRAPVLPRRAQGARQEMCDATLQNIYSRRVAVVYTRRRPRTHPGRVPFSPLGRIHNPLSRAHPRSDTAPCQWPGVQVDTRSASP